MVLKGSARVQPRWIVAAVLAVHAIFFLSPPLALTDIFNYINYGRMEVVHHLNPYTTIPILEPHNDPSFVLSNWHQLLSPYGPLFTLLTFAVVPLGVAASFWALKAMLALGEPRDARCSCGSARGCSGATRSRAIVLVGLNPIVLVWGLGGDHNDFLMLLLHRARLLPAAARRASRERARGRSEPPLARMARAALAGADRRRRGVRRRGRDQGLGRRC